MQNPRLPRCWYTPGQAADKQILKPHQLSGLRFMYDCLVREHSSAAIERRQQEQQKSKGKRKQKGQNKLRQQTTAEEQNSDFQSISGGSSKGGSESPERSNKGDGTASGQSEADDAGGCILAHSMGLGKSFQTVALLWVFFQKM